MSQMNRIQAMPCIDEALNAKAPSWKALIHVDRRSIAVRLRWLALGGVLAFGLGLAGCKPNAESQDLGAGITGYNFTNGGVQEFYVQDMRGSNLPPYGGGGATSCCVKLPRQWTPDLKVKVDWTIGHYTAPWEKRKSMTIAEETACCWTERTLSKVVPIQRYGDGGEGLQVFFLPHDELEVWVFNAGPQNSEHPSQRGYPKKPADVE